MEKTAAVLHVAFCRRGRILNMDRERGGEACEGWVRVVRRAPLALAYGCADEERLREVFAAMGAQVRVLKGEDWGTRLWRAGGRRQGPAGEAEAAAPQQSVLVFAYFTDALLDKAACSASHGAARL